MSIYNPLGETIMDPRLEDLLDLETGELLTEDDMTRLIGSVPPQPEFAFSISEEGRGRSLGFRRWDVEGRRVWQVR